MKKVVVVKHIIEVHVQQVLIVQVGLPGPHGPHVVSLVVRVIRQEQEHVLMVNLAMLDAKVNGRFDLK